MGARGRWLTAVAVALLAAVPGVARGERGCGRVVIFALPGVTWSDVARVRPPALLNAAAQGGAGSVSVRVAGPRTDYASGFLTVGAGSRLEGAPTLRSRSLARGQFARAEIEGLGEVRSGALQAGYGARPGALGSALSVPVTAVGSAGFGRPPPVPSITDWVLLAAMNSSGTVDSAAVGPRMLRRAPEAPFGVRTDHQRTAAALVAALRRQCGLTVFSDGDLIRADQSALVTGHPRAPAERAALTGADRLLARVRRHLDPSSDLLLIVSPTTPAAAKEARLGVAIAEGPGFEPGSSLVSASTRRRGTVTLPDVAPTVLEHYGVDAPPSMTGRTWLGRGGAPDRIRDAIALDDESVFVDRVTRMVAWGFIAVQAVVFVAGVVAVSRPGVSAAAGGWLEPVLLAVAAFPLATYAMGVVDGHTLSWAAFVALLGAVDLALVVAASAALSDRMSRLLAVYLATVVVLVADLALGARLQINTVLGYSPIVGGRFAGLGNMGFAVLSAAALGAGAILVHRLGRTRPALAAAGGLFVVAIVADGAPGLGSDIGGTLALVPTLGLTWLLLAGKRPRPTVALFLLAGAVAILALFLAVDLSRPAEDRTHLARLYESVLERGPDALVSTAQRKAVANLRLLGTSVWTVPVVPAAGALAWVALWPRGQWQRLAVRVPALAAGVLGAVALSLLGFAVNDSGIAIPAMVLALFVPFAFFARFCVTEGGGGL